MQRLALVVLTSMIALVALNDSSWAGHRNTQAKIAIHLTAITGKGSVNCSMPPGPPACNEGESNLLVTGDLSPQEYFAYLLVLDGDAEIGIQGAEFGISYNDSLSFGVDIDSWTKCSSLEISSGGWPDSSGSGVLLTWTTCQDDPASGDYDSGVTVVLGALRLTAYTQDVLSIIPRPRTASTPSLAVVSCSVGDTTLSALTKLDHPWATGQAAFGGAEGFDPCKGSYVPFSEFDSLSTNEAETVQIKISDLRPRWVPPLILQGSMAVEDPNQFDLFRRIRMAYPHEYGVTRHSIQTLEIQAIIDSLSTISDFTAGDEESLGVMSVALLKTFPETVAFESIMDSTTGVDVLGAIRNALGEAHTSRSMLDLIICNANLIPPQAPTDVTGSAEITIGGFRLDQETDQFWGKVKVKNTSGTTLQAPLSLSLREVSSVEVVSPEADGTACRLPYPNFYINLDVGSGLASGESVELDLILENPYGKKFDLTPALFSGPGVR